MLSINIFIPYIGSKSILLQSNLPLVPHSKELNHEQAASRPVLTCDCRRPSNCVIFIKLFAITKGVSSRMRRVTMSLKVKGTHCLRREYVC